MEGDHLEIRILILGLGPDLILGCLGGDLWTKTDWSGRLLRFQKLGYIKRSFQGEEGLLEG